MGKPRRIDPVTLAELLSVHCSCVHSQEHKCPLLVSVSSLCWEINQFCGTANEEDKAFRRTGADGLCAARPLRREDFGREDM